jgi:hypothetical protein
MIYAKDRLRKTIVRVLGNSDLRIGEMEVEINDPQPIYFKRNQYTHNSVDGWVSINPDREQILDLEKAENEAGELVNRKQKRFASEVAQIKSGYSEDEIKSWPDQRAEAEGWKADNNYITTLIDSIIAETGEEKLAFVDNVLEKARLYKIAFGGSLGRKRS